MAEYLKLTEVARRLDVSEKTARRYVKSGALPSVFIGGAYRVSERDLEEFLENAKVDPGKVPASSQPSFNGLLEEESLSRFSEAIIAVAAKWGEAMSNSDMDDTKRPGLIEAALDLSGVIAERVEEEDWETIPNQERLAIVTTMERLTEVAGQGIRHLQESGEARAQEEEVKQRREQMREWNRRKSA